MTQKLRKIQRAGNWLMASAVLLLGWGVWVGFVEADSFGIAHQISGHIAIMIGGGLIKLGYVVRLATEHEASQMAAA